MKKDEYINKIKSLFLSYFKINGYKKNNTFETKNVFFLNSNDKKKSSSSFDNLKSLALSNNNMDIIHKIINKTVNDNNESDNKEISVNLFIDNLINYIFLLNEKIEEIELNLIKNNVYKNLKIIPNIISILNNENENIINKNSNLKISIIRLDNIKQGKYKITLHFTFSKKEKKHYSIKDIIIKPNQENQIVKVNYIFPIIVFDKNDDEEEKENEFKNGSNIISFYIKMIDISKEETIFKSKKQYFQNIFRSYNFINNINEGMDNIYYKLDFKFGSNEELKIYFFFDFNLNIQTKINILKNYFEYYNENIKIKNEKEDEINFILDKYFPEISGNIKNNLIEYNNSEFNYNNNSCNCF